LLAHIVYFQYLSGIKKDTNMFKESEKNKQMNLFSSPHTYLSGSAGKFYSNPLSWHNQFREQVVARVDESIFSVLFHDDNGAPNYPARVLVGMSILKEGLGCSDSELFSRVSFDMLTRSALGLMSLEDKTPSPSTWYLFRKKIVEHDREFGDDLMRKCMAQITREQMLEFNVAGSKIRMDSKLIGSNIANCTRYGLIHDTIALFLEEREKYIKKRRFSDEDTRLMKEILEQTGEHAVYTKSDARVKADLPRLGVLIQHLLRVFQKYPHGQYQTLERVFDEQFETAGDGTLVLKESKRVGGRSVQSPHDTDCTFRDKGGNKVKGYSINVTETCDDQPGDEDEDADPALNLISDVQVKDASAADNDYLQSAVDNTGELTCSDVENLYVDGAYNSSDNREYCEENQIQLILTGLQGRPSRYDLSFDDAQDTLTVIDRETGEIQQAIEAKPKKNTPVKRWRIKTGKGYRYFDENDVEVSMLRRRLEEIPKEETNTRNNVEATIFQLGYHCPHGKTRYRTLGKHKLWAYSRSAWINFRRILKHVTTTSERTLSGQLSSCFFTGVPAKISFLVKIFFNNVKFLKSREETAFWAVS
jgi:hypothetical protein